MECAAVARPLRLFSFLSPCRFPNHSWLLGSLEPNEMQCAQDLTSALPPQLSALSTPVGILLYGPGSHGSSHGDGRKALIAIYWPYGSEDLRSHSED